MTLVGLFPATFVTLPELAENLPCILPRSEMHENITFRSEPGQYILQGEDF